MEGEEVKGMKQSQAQQQEVETVKAIEKILKQFIKSKSLNEEAFQYMALIVHEDCPKNEIELISLLQDFMTYGMAYSEQEVIQQCKTMIKVLHEQKLLKIEQRDTIVAEKLNNPIVINEMKKGPSGVVREDDFLDNFLGEKGSDGNYNTFDGKPWEQSKKKKKQANEFDALDLKIEEFKEFKKRVPPPQVVHDKGDGFKNDILINGLTLIAGGKTLLENAQLKLVQGRKYGLVGRNGIGKTTLINALCKKELEKFPQNIHILQVEQEIEGDNVTVLQHILNCDIERESLIKQQADIIKQEEAGNLSEDQKKENIKKMQQIFERMSHIQSDKAENKAVKILIGLGFQQHELNIQSKDFSGGWRMRIAIAKAIFCEPEILLLDEPTNHLDLNALIWLEDYIQKLEITVLIVSHARDFLNAVCEEIIHFFNMKLTYYKGNFDMFEKVRNEKMRLQKKQRDSQQTSIDHIQKFIDKFRYNAKRASLVQSRIKRIQKMDIIEEVISDPTCVFIFPNPEKISPPMLRLDEAVIGYGENKVILDKVNINVDQETRIALVGPNGAGKSTLLKALINLGEEVDIIKGTAYRHPRLRIGVFTQHHIDSLDLRLSALEQMMVNFPGNHSEKFRSHLGSFGISANLALRPMYLLSGGQKSRVAFAMITWSQPHILLLDEPTNHLDFDAINALIVALNNYEGGLVVVSHDQYFLSSVCDRMYVVKHKKVKIFEGDIDSYRKSLLK